MTLLLGVCDLVCSAVHASNAEMHIGVHDAKVHKRLDTASSNN